MNVEQRQKLESMFDLTSHPGWKVLGEDLEKRVDALKEGLATREATIYQLGLAHGHIKVYRELISLRDLIEMILKQDQEDMNEQAAAV